jgi:hypothetical protein
VKTPLVYDCDAIVLIALIFMTSVTAVVAINDVCVMVCVLVPDDAMRVDWTNVPFSWIPSNRLPVVPDPNTPYAETRYKPIRRTVISPVVVFTLKILSAVVDDEE